MRRFLNNAPIGRKLAFAMLGLSVLMLVLELSFQMYFSEYVGRLNQSNVDFVMERIADEVRDTFSAMDAAAGYISVHPLIQDYAATVSVTERYRKAYTVATPIVQIATQNLHFDHVLIQESSGAWYRFTGLLPNSSCRALSTGFEELWGGLNTVVSLDDSMFFCTIKPILGIQGGVPVKTGMVATLSGINKVRKLLSDWEMLDDISILLHNGVTVLISNNSSLEDLEVEEVISRENHYTRATTILPNSLFLTVSLPTEQVFPQRAAIFFTFAAIGFFSLVFILSTGILVNRWIVNPVTRVMEDMKKLGESDLKGRLATTGAYDIDVLITGINGMLGRLEDYNRRVFSTQQALYETELNRQKMKMTVLKKQIDAHFLYNSLTSIKSLADKGKIESVGEISQGVAMLLRYANSLDEEVNIFEEIEIAGRFIKIMNIRFSEKFIIYYDVDDLLCAYKILKLLLQPLIENALIHGLENKLSDCRLYIRGYMKDGGIFIEVEDNGAGIPSERLSTIKQNIRELNSDGLNNWNEGIQGIALANINMRIKLRYGDEYGLTLDSAEGEYTKAVLHIPAITDM